MYNACESPHKDGSTSMGYFEHVKTETRKQIQENYNKLVIIEIIFQWKYKLDSKVCVWVRVLCGHGGFLKTCVWSANRVWRKA